ncbi:Thiol-specific monooxygenase [Daldinia childiae]|uniref:Thiol-specific monooxygenase n=1 Tax=Daldinia childiae TaxID=326645 RepID=UPI0014464DCC|nr:Thiol-specific monooxygenase [Daldinia childiae]XP_033437668.1 Thiol-specific monooxygenase [Daldinia childiae]KAF3056565.1 Thiol-specific monooxygenase [Daldinia childiae]KAF3062793.1 Thiol-specific monooxygenase [Daldinia childiae]
MGSFSPSSATATLPFNVKNIAVIGAGPSGLAAAKYLLAQDGAFSRIDVFEQQAEVGGVWNYSPVPRPAEALPVPQTDAHPKRPDPPVYVPEGKVPLFPSPMYDDLHTNIPHTLMKYSDLAFPEGCDIFPTRSDVQAYLVEYARDVRHLIKFSTQVTDVSLRSVEGQPRGREQEQWDVRTTDLLTGEETTETYDAVVVASGHYSTPYIPDSVEGIAAFHAKHLGVISHSKLYRNAEPYRGKKVVVVGTGASGLDIAAQIQRVCKTPLILSAQTAAPPETLEHIGNPVQVGQIKRFLIEERGVEFFPLDEDEDDSAGKKERRETRIETDIDAILFSTGYLYTFPFLPTIPLVTNGRQVHGLAKHLLHIAHPTLAFPGLPIKVIPFPLTESQGAVLARLWSNTVPLPPVSVLKQWAREDGEGTSEGKYHVFPKGGDGRYINGLYEWLEKESLGGRGKEPPHWDAEMLWQRGIYAEAKMQYEKTGKKAKTLEELGFRYVPEEVKVKKAEDVEGRDPHLDIAG